MNTCSVCGEPILRNDKLGVWAHLPSVDIDHWATPGKPCGCNTDDARNHAVDCDARIVHDVG